MRFRKPNRLKPYLLISTILIALTFQLLNSCNGSSPSSRRKHQQKYNTTQSTGNKATQREPSRPRTNYQTNSSEGSSNSSSVADLFKKLEPSVFAIITGNEATQEVSQGSAFLIGSNIGITNFHVIANPDHDLYAYINDDLYSIQILRTSPEDQLDYAIFRIEDFYGTPLKIAPKRSEIGEDVFAIGSPQGLLNSLTKGTISGYRQNSRIQIDATIDHGSSGGALFNMNGEVIGITTSGVAGKELNFAVDISEVPYRKYQN